MNNADIEAGEQQHFICKQLLPPSGVSHCCSAYFTHTASHKGHELPNLILARQNILQVYKARRSQKDDESCWLELIGEHSLQGTIESLATLKSRAPGIQRDAILLTFRDAKLAVLDWDELLGDIFTSSLHSWEKDPLILRTCTQAPPLGPQALTDPQGRCAAILLYSNSLALLPSSHAELIEADADSPSTSLSARLESSYTVSLSRLGLKEARDACFLHRYNEPVLLILHEGNPTWAGLLVNKKDTMCLTAYSLNLTHQKHLRLWHVSNLPSDAHKLIPVPLGGAIVLCQSLLLYHSQGVSCSLAVNSKAYAGVVPPYMNINPHREAPSVTASRHAEKFCTNIEPDAASSISKGAPRAEGFELDLQNSHGIWLTPSTLMLSLSSGQIVLVVLEVSGGSVRKIKIEKANEATRASCLCSVGSSWVFIGSWLGDSLLLHATSSDKPKKTLQLEAPKKEVLAIEGPKTSEANEQNNAHNDGSKMSPQNKPENTSNNATNGAPENLQNGEVDLKVPKHDQDKEESVLGQEEVKEKEEVHLAKKPRLESGIERNDDKEKEDVEDDEFESLFQSIETARISTLKLAATKFTFKVVDSLLGLGPIRSVIEVKHSRNGSSSSSKNQYIACLGLDNTGAIGTMTQNIQAETITKQKLSGIRGLWAVRFKPEGLPWEPDFGFHAFLVLSMENNSTKILETGANLTEMKAQANSFAFEQQTLIAGNLLSLARIVQVCPDRVVFLAGSSKVSETSVQDLLKPPSSPTGVQGEKALQASLPENSANVEILSASIQDPYVLLHLSNGSAALLLSSLDSGRLEIVQASREYLYEVPVADFASNITSCTLYKDCSGWLAKTSEVESQVFCVTCNAKGLLQIFALPEMTLVFDHCPIAEGSPALSGDPFAEANIQKDPEEEDGQGDGNPEIFSTRPIVIETKMESFSGNEEFLDEDERFMAQYDFMPCERPVLILLLSDGGMLCYQAFSSPLGLRFSKLNLDWLSLAEGRESRGASNRMTRFDGIGESHKYSGIFITGTRPLWLIAVRGRLISHKMELDGAVLAMTPFNNLNCPQGFITIQESGGEGSLHITTFPLGFRLDFPWPIRKVALGSTPNHLIHLSELDIFCCSISRQVPHQKWLPEEEGGDLQATYAYVSAKTSAKEKGKEEISQIRLLHATRWNSAWRHDLMPAEKCQCIRYLALQDTFSGTFGQYLIIGTAFSYGEDYPCTGRILVFKLSKVEAEFEGQSSTTWSGTLLYQREVQGPVTNIVSIDGLLIVAWGSRLESFAWKGQRLETTCFHEASVLITSLSSIKRYLLIGDIHKSVTFLDLVQGNHSFENLSKDFDNCDVVASEFVPRQRKLFVMVGDGAQNLRMFQYQIDHSQSWSGKRLIPVGAFHTGHEIASIVRKEITPLELQKGIVGALIFNLDGSVECLSPTWHEGLTPPFRALRRLLESKIPQACGLNPQTYRQRHKYISKALGGGESWGKSAPSSTIFDGDLLWQFQFSTHSQQVSISQKLGFEKKQILELLDSLAVALT